MNSICKRCKNIYCRNRDDIRERNLPGCLEEKKQKTADYYKDEREVETD